MQRKQQNERLEEAYRTNAEREAINQQRIHD